MKKNISINIFGTIYAIDEDAYQLLDNYLDSMKNYFMRQEGGEEIADDIEHRVAELLWENKQNGMEAVSIEVIKEIISKIGNADEINEETAIHENGENTNYGKENTNTSTTENSGQQEQAQSSAFFDKIKTHMRERHLYRNTNDKMLGGVCSGLSEYFGVGDPVLWRIGAIILTFVFMGAEYWFVPDFLHVFFPVAYIILWILVPEARTAEEKLRMRGKKITPENLSDQIVNDSEEQEAKTPQPVRNNGGCIRFFFYAFLLLMLAPMFLALLAVIIALIVAMFAAIFGVSALMAHPVPELAWLTDAISSNPYIVIMGLVAIIIVIGIPIYGIIRAIRRNTSPMRNGTLFTLIIAWIIALAISFAACGVVGVRAAEGFKVFHENHITIEQTTDSLENELDTIENYLEEEFTDSIINE